MNAHLNPDVAIDQVLDALRATEPPTGLEQRIAARLAQAAEARTLTPSPSAAASSLFAVILKAVKHPAILLALARRYSVAIPAALTILIALTAITVVHHRTPATTAQTLPVHDPQTRAPHLSDGAVVSKEGITPGTTALPSLEAAGLQSRYTPSASNPSLAGTVAHAPSPSAKDPAAQNPAAQDPDQLALAETLAPSRPAPPMPLTAQEQVMVAATRPGQPLQLAELDQARAPILRAETDARRNADMKRYVENLLAPFALADALQPTKFSEPREISTAAPAPLPPTSSN
jgi:hypothetical protein